MSVDELPAGEQPDGAAHKASPCCVCSAPKRPQRVAAEVAQCAPDVEPGGHAAREKGPLEGQRAGASGVISATECRSPYAGWRTNPECG